MQNIYMQYMYPLIAKPTLLTINLVTLISTEILTLRDWFRVSETLQGTRNCIR